jgi:hypothetical protein
MSNLARIGLTNPNGTTAALGPKARARRELAADADQRRDYPNDIPACRASPWWSLLHGGVLPDGGKKIPAQLCRGAGLKANLGRQVGSETTIRR